MSQKKANTKNDDESRMSKTGAHEDEPGFSGTIMDFATKDSSKFRASSDSPPILFSSNLYLDHRRASLPFAR